MPNPTDSLTEEARKPGVGTLTKELILKGLNNEQIIAELKEAFPNAANSEGNVRWYRNALRKSGELPAKSDAPKRRRAVERRTDDIRPDATKEGALVPEKKGRKTNGGLVPDVSQSLEQIGRTLKALGDTLVKLDVETRREKAKSDAVLKNLRGLLG